MSEAPTTITVRGAKIGILGLQRVFLSVRQLALSTDAEVKAELLTRAKEDNYIAPAAEEAYTEALFREYRRWLGEIVEEESPEGLVIKVLGPGCYACDKLMKDVVEILAELGIAADVEHVRELKRIGSYGMVGVPALVINNCVVVSGSLPAKKRLRALIEEVQKTSAA